jgi:hypothetical protein
MIRAENKPVMPKLPDPPGAKPRIDDYVQTFYEQLQPPTTTPEEYIEAVRRASAKLRERHPEAAQETTGYGIQCRVGDIEKFQAELQHWNEKNEAFEKAVKARSEWKEVRREGRDKKCTPKKKHARSFKSCWIRWIDLTLR